MIKIKFNIVFIIIINLLIGLNVDVSSAGTNEIIVVNNYPISHPDYEMDNYWATGRNPWNLDHTRIMMMEYGRSDISPKTNGRGLVWGFINELRSAANGLRSEYEVKAHPVSLNPTTYSYYAEWSISPGEENIIYALKNSSKMVVKINVDTGVEENIISFDKAGYDVSNAKTIGWTTDNKLIVFFNITNLYSGGWEIDVQKRSETFFASWPSPCEADGRYARYPPGPKSIHSDKSLDGKYRIRYSASGSGDNGVWYSDYTDPSCDTGSYEACQTNTAQCPTYVDDNSYSITHPSWHTNNEWFIAANVGSPYTYNSKTNNPPYMATFDLVQVIFDRVNFTFSRNIILTMINPGVRKPNYPYSGDTDNYQGGIPSPTLRLDNRQFMYISTDGKYSTEDYSYCQYFPSEPICLNVNLVTNRSGRRVYLADISPTSGTQACTSFTYSAWSECQPNNTQTRTVTSSSPSGCTGGNPVLTQSCTYNARIPSHSILKTISSPTIDGNLGEYALANSISFSPSSGGNTVTVRTLWNSEALFLGINVTDSQLNASAITRDGSVWSDDSIEWFIDAYNDGGGFTNLSSAFMLPDDYHGIINILNAKYDSQGTTSGTPSSSWDGAWQSAVKLNGTNNSNTDNDTGYTIEIKIPWASIGYSSAPTTETSVGMSFAVNDNDASGITSLMFPNITTSYENASNWQTVLFSGTVSIVDATPPAPPMALVIQ